MRPMFLLALLLLASVAAASDSKGLNSLVFADGFDRTPADFAGQSIAVITFNGKC